jgi:hypothetical protein
MNYSPPAMASYLIKNYRLTGTILVLGILELFICRSLFLHNDSYSVHNFIAGYTGHMCFWPLFYKERMARRTAWRFHINL